MASLGSSLNRRAVLGSLAACGLAASVSTRAGDAKTQKGGFVRRQGMGFTRHGKPYRYAGANAWYLAWLGSDETYGNRPRLGHELDRLKALGVGNVRILAGAEEGPLRNSIRPGFVNKRGELNQHLLIGLDHAMAELGKRGMTAVLYLTNNWEWSGGMMTLLSYETGTFIDMNDPAQPWPAFPDAASEFYANAGAVARFRSYVSALVTRTNSVTGMRYADDPALMAWQLCNEPRPGETPAIMERHLPTYYKWIDESAALIRSFDPNHLVSLGMEGTIACGGREDIVLRAHRNIDYMTAHVWPLNWGWVDGKNLAGTWQAGSAKVRDYVDKHIGLARAAGMPLVFEEFGFPRDGEAYTPSSGTRYREDYYRLIYGAVEASLDAGGPVAGSNFWAWNGEARARHPDWHFQNGDNQFMGDPPHEPQGWYGTFSTDKRVKSIIAAHAARFATHS